VEDTKGAIKIHISKNTNKNTMAKRKSTKGKRTFCKT
jgi:hypothetical protein